MGLPALHHKRLGAGQREAAVERAVRSETQRELRPVEWREPRGFVDSMERAQADLGLGHDGPALDETGTTGNREMVLMT
jgi:hypothetical protein